MLSKGIVNHEAWIRTFSVRSGRTGRHRAGPDRRDNDGGAPGSLLYSLRSLDGREEKVDFEVRPGANPDQLVLVIPTTLEHRGCWRAEFRDHEFLLNKAGDGSYKAHDPGRPKVSLSFKSASKASLYVWGRDANGTCMNGYTLVRP